MEAAALQKTQGYELKSKKYQRETIMGVEVDLNNNKILFSLCNRPSLNHVFCVRICMKKI
jgi:hypothetical protein